MYLPFQKKKKNPKLKKKKQPKKKQTKNNQSKPSLTFFVIYNYDIVEKT